MIYIIASTVYIPSPFLIYSVNYHILFSTNSPWLFQDTALQQHSFNFWLDYFLHILSLWESCLRSSLMIMFILEIAEEQPTFIIDDF